MIYQPSVYTVAFPKNVHFSLSFLFGFAVFLFQDITTKINGFSFNLAASDLSYGTQDPCCIMWELLLRHRDSSWRHVGCSSWSRRALELRHTGSRVGLSSVAVVWAQFLCYVWDLSSQTRDSACVPDIARQIRNRWTTKEVPKCIFFFKEWLTNYQCSWPLKKWGPWAPIPIHHHTSSGKSLYSFIVSTLSVVLHFWIQSTADHIALYLLLKKFHVRSIHAVQTRVVQRSAVNSNILISTVFIFFWGSFQYILT